MKHSILALSIICLFVASACNAQQPTLAIHLGGGKVGCNVTGQCAASKAIVYDKRDGFLKK